jgi:esterase FrsA
MSSSRSARNLVAGGGRDLATLKAEVQRRADRAMPPLSGISAMDARKALSTIDSLDRDVWASAWYRIADDYAAQAQELKRDDRKQAISNCWNAWRLYHFARWPTENATVKHQAKARAVEMFARYAALLDPPIERVRIASPLGELRAYLRLPSGVRSAPLVFGIAGLDSRKEDIAAHTDAYLKLGIGIFAIDLPGTGESPITPASVDADRLFSAALDYLAARTDVDATRIVVQGRSWSGYWAAKLAVTERARLRGCVMHGGPIHHYFQPEWLARSLATGEYLYDYFEAKCAMFGVTTLEEMVERAREFSLLDLGVLDEPCAPMLLVNGARDSQIPIADLFLLLERGTPKDAWVNPSGGHMGRSADWPASRIAQEVLLPWIVRAIE